MNKITHIFQYFISKLLVKYLSICAGIFITLFQSNAQNMDKNIDSLSVNQKKDSTIKLFIPIQIHNSLNLLSQVNSIDINKKDLLFEQYTSLYDILKNHTNANYLDLGSYGQMNSLSFFGGTSHDISMRFNNNKIYDNLYDNTFIEAFNPEFYENIEIVYGSDAVILSDNSSGALINLQEIKYNTKYPYTKLWYSQAAYNHIAADGVYSQNIMPNTNFTFGFRSRSSEGRYNNNEYDNWSIRSALRYNFSDYKSISLTEFFTNYGIRENGGINSDSKDLYDEITASINLKDNRTRVFRHNLSLAYTSMSPDSNSAFNTNVFANFAENSNQFDYFLKADTVIKDHYYSNYFGINSNIEKTLQNNLFIKAGLEAISENTQKSFFYSKQNIFSYSAYSQLKYLLNSNNEIKAGLRYYNNDNHLALSIGANYKYKIGSKAYIAADASFSQRLANITERENISPAINSLKNEQTALFILNYHYSNYENFFEASIYARQTVNPIIVAAMDTIAYNKMPDFINGKDKRSIGIGLKTGFYLKKSIWIDSKLDLNTTIVNQKFQPLYPLAQISISPYYKVTYGKSEARIGMDLEIFSGFKGQTYLPLCREYYPTEKSQKFNYNGINIFVSARLGNAFVKISLDNILSNGYYYVPDYPAYDRVFKLSVNWEFIN